MLVANLDQNRIEASLAEKGPEYRCPGCNGIVNLKKGRIVIHHFAHRPPTNCLWAKGETREHREAKKLVATGLAEKGLRTEVEYVVDTMTGDRRADVMVWSSNDSQLAIELQHSTISLDDIERRTRSYASAGITQIWIPFLKESVLDNATRNTNGTLLVEKYSARPFEKWIHGLNGKNGMWMYAPSTREFYHASLAPHQIYVESSSWYSEGGEEQSAGGYYKNSKRWRELTLTGPFKLEQLRLKTFGRTAYSIHVYNWPAARLAKFSTD